MYLRVVSMSFMLSVCYFKVECVFCGECVVYLQVLC